MIGLVIILLVAGAGYLGYVIGVDVGMDRDRPCPHCRIQRRTVEAELELQRLTQAALHQMRETARQAQFEQRDELP